MLITKGFKMARQQFPFYKSFDDIAEDLTDNQLAKYIRTLLDVQFLRIKIDDVSFSDKMLNLIWKSQKHSIKKSINGFLDGQRRDTIKHPYFGVYDDNFVAPTEGKQEGIQTPKAEVQVQCKEQGKGKEQVQYINSKEANNLFIEYLALRKKLKLSNSQTVIKRLLNKLKEFWKNGHNDCDVISNAITGSWKDFYEPKQQVQQSKSFKQQDKERANDTVDTYMNNDFNLREHLGSNNQIESMEVITHDRN